MIRKAISICLAVSVFSAQASFANSFQDQAEKKVQASKETARDIARAYLLRSLINTLVKVEQNVRVVGPETNSLTAQEAFEKVMAHLNKLNNNIDKVSVQNFEKDVAEELSKQIQIISDAYKEAQKEWLKAANDLNNRLSIADRLVHSANNMVAEISDLCGTGFAASVDRSQMPLPHLTPPEEGVRIDFKYTEGGTFESSPSSQSVGPFKDSPELNTLFALGASYGTGAAATATATAVAGSAAAAWTTAASIAAGTGVGLAIVAVVFTVTHMLNSAEQLEEMRRMTDAQFYFYKNVATSADVQAYYRELCKPSLSKIKQLPQVMMGLQSTDPSLYTPAKNEFDQLRSTTGPQLVEILKLQAPMAAAQQKLRKSLALELGEPKTQEQQNTFNSEFEKRAAQLPESQAFQKYTNESVSIENMFDIVRYVMMSLALASKNLGKDAAPIKERAQMSYQKLTSLDAQIHSLRALKYKLLLQHQHPDLVSALENEIRASNDVRELYRGWVNLLAQATVEAFGHQSNGDLKQNWEMWHRSLLSSLKENPLDPALTELEERGQIIETYIKGMLKP